MSAQRLLFVDDEVPILRALERMLRVHRRDWECHFTDDPRHALTLVDEVQPDAVVSDMLMPGLDGAELLLEASRRRPLLARFILSGEVGAGSLVRMARAAHQCLAKPCRGDVLLGVLQRALITAAPGHDPVLLGAVYGLRSLPVAAARVETVRRQLARPWSEARDRDVVALLSGTAALATKLLQVATWTRLGMGTPPAHVHDAYYQLGPDAVRALLDPELLAPLPADEATAFQHATWRRAERAAAAASAIAQAETLPPDDARLAALVALWAASAPLLADSACRAQYDTARDEAAATGAPLHVIERRVFGLSAADALAHLLQLWGLSPAVAESVTRSDAAATLPESPVAVETVAHVTRALLDELDGHPLPDATAAHLDRVGLGGRLDAWRGLVARVLEPVAA